MSHTYVNPNPPQNLCKNENLTIYNGTGSVERVSPHVNNTGNVYYTIANGMFDTVSANGTPAMGSYCWEDVIDGLNAVNAINPGFIWQFNYSMNWFEVNDYMSKNAPGEYIKVQTTTCQCTTGPCYCSPCWHNSSYANCREFGVTGNSGLGWVPGSVQQADWAPFESTTSTSVTWLPSTMSFIDVSVTDANGVNVTSWLQDLLLAVNAGTAYNISITTMYNATTSESVFTVDSVSAIATSSSGGDYYRIYLSWDSSSANANLLAHGVRICFYVSGTSPYGSMNHSGPNCIYSTVNLQLCIDSASATPCCVPPPSLKKANLSECSEVLGRYLLTDDGKQIKINKVNYVPDLGNYSFGNCVIDPKDNKFKCCTFDGQSDLQNNKSIACRIINGKFINEYGIWRSCERPTMLWDCVSSVNSCGGFEITSEGYVGSFISMSQVDDYYEKLEPTENINKTHFNLSLSPVDLSLSESDYGWCESSNSKYVYSPKYRLLVTPTPTVVVAKVVGGSGIGCCIALKCPDKGKGCKCRRYTVQGSGVVTCKCEGSCGDKHVGISHQQIEADSFNDFISAITESYKGITINNTMKFNKIKSVVIGYMKFVSSRNGKISSFDVSVGITPQPIEDVQVNCTCKQTTKGRYKTELECLSSKKNITEVAPTGFHYMPDGTLMSDAEHKMLY